MIPASFDYHAPKTLDEAIALLGRLGDTAKIQATPGLPLMCWTAWLRKRSESLSNRRGAGC